MICEFIVRISYANFQSLTYEFVALNQSWGVVAGPSGPRWSAVSAVANGYQCN